MERAQQQLWTPRSPSSCPCSSLPFHAHPHLPLHVPRGASLRPFVALPKRGLGLLGVPAPRASTLRALLPCLPGYLGWPLLFNPTKLGTSFTVWSHGAGKGRAQQAWFKNGWDGHRLSAVPWTWAQGKGFSHPDPAWSSHPRNPRGTFLTSRSSGSAALRESLGAHSMRFLPRCEEEQEAKAAPGVQHSWGVRIAGCCLFPGQHLPPGERLLPGEHHPQPLSSSGSSSLAFIHASFLTTPIPLPSSSGEGFTKTGLSYSCIIPSSGWFLMMEGRSLEPAGI